MRIKVTAAVVVIVLLVCLLMGAVHCYEGVFDEEDPEELAIQQLEEESEELIFSAKTQLSYGSILKPLANAQKQIAEATAKTSSDAAALKAKQEADVAAKKKLEEEQQAKADAEKKAAEEKSAQEEEAKKAQEEEEAKNKAAADEAAKRAAQEKAVEEANKAAQLEAERIEAEEKAVAAKRAEEAAAREIEAKEGADAKELESNNADKTIKSVQDVQHLAQDILMNELNQECQSGNLIEIFGVAISNCAVALSNDVLIVKGDVTLASKYVVTASLLIAKDDDENAKVFVLTLSLSNAFKLSGIISSLKGSRFDTLSFAEPTIRITNSANNPLGLAPGILFSGKVVMSDSNDAVAPLSTLFTADTQFQASLELSAGTDIKELFSSSAKKDVTLTLSASGLNLGNKRIQCTDGAVSISTLQPTLKAEAACTLILHGSSSVALNVAVSVGKQEGSPSLAVTGAVVGSTANSFGIGGFSIAKAAVTGVYNKGLKDLTFGAEGSLKNVKFTIDGNLVSGEYKFALVDTSLADVLGLFGLSEVQSKVPSITLHQVQIVVATKTGTADAPTLKISAETETKIMEYTIDSSAVIEFSREKVQFTAAVDNAMTFGPLTLSQPSISFTALRTQSQFELVLSGTTSIWKLNNLRATVGFAKTASGYGWLVAAQLDQTFKLSDAVSAIKDIPVINGLGLKNPEVQISSYPVTQIDNVPRQGVVFKASLVFGSSDGALGGVKMLFGGKVNEVPLIIPFGAGLTPNVKDLKITAVLPSKIPVKSDVITFADGTFLTVAVSPPAFGLAVDMTVKIPKDDQPLRFKLAFQLDAIGGSGSTETMSEWVNPFGLKGVIIKKIGVDVGVNYVQFSTTGTPSRLGIMGHFAFPQVGDVKIATLADIAKQQYVLSFSIDKFGTQSLRQLLADLGATVPQDLLPDIEFRNSKAYISPSGGNIGSVSFEPGFNFQGDIWVFEKLFASVDTKVSTSTGIKVYGKVVASSIGPLDISESLIDIAVTPFEQYLSIKGRVSLQVVFQVSPVVDIRLSKSLLYFKVDTPTFALEASATPKRPQDLTISGTSKLKVLNNLTAMVKKTIGKVGDYLSSLHKELEKLEAKKQDIKKAINGLKLPSNCGSVTAAAATLAEETNDYRQLLTEYDEEFGISEWIAQSEEAQQQQQEEEEEEDLSSVVYDDAESKVEEVMPEEVEEQQQLHDTLSIGRFVRRLGRRAARDVRNAGRAVTRTARDVADDAAELEKKLCKRALSKLNSLKSELASATASATAAATKYSGEAAKYSADFLKDDFFTINRISFTSSLANIKDTGAMKISVSTTVAGADKTFTYTLKFMNKIYDIANDLAEKITKKTF